MKDQHDRQGSAPTLAISAREIQLRKAWLELDERDEAIITREIKHLLCEQVDELMETMYRHFLAFEETRSFFPDGATLERAKSAQRQYFLRLAEGRYDEDYVRDRLRIGSTHHRIDLDPKWYLGAYNRVLSMLVPMMVERSRTDAEKLSSMLLAFLKVMFFDMGLAFESYIGAKEAAIRRHRDAIQELQTEQRVTKGILESAPIGIVTLSKDLICLECNDEFVAIVEVPFRKETVGKSLFELAPHLNRDLFEEVLSTGQPCRRSAERLQLSQSPQAEETYWDWATWPVKDDSGAISGLVAMFTNATDRVLLQQQREDFVATLTHDLKTPVLATNRAVGFLLDGDFGPISDAQRELLETLLQSNNALYSLVQTLLDVYRFDSGVKDLHIARCNLAAVITQMVTEIMPLAQHKGVNLTAVVPGDAVEVSCDEEEVRRVIQNLLDNSLKFTTSGGSITIKMEQSHETTLISVADTGKGIPEENKPKLFQRFWQAGSTGRYYASTGLGLYLCRRIVEGHGGKIWCESMLGKGSTFYFELRTAQL